MKDKLQPHENTTYVNQNKLSDMQLNTEDQIKISDSVIVINLMDKTLVINVDKANWIRTNETGYQIIKKLEYGSSVEELKNQISKVYEVPKDLIEEDIMLFINNCYKRDLIDSNNRKLVPKRSEENIITGSLKTVYLDITGACNLKCPYCYVAESNNETNDLEPEQWTNVIKEIDNMHIDNLYITGGEPLLRTDLFNILEEANVQNIKTIGLLTNGTEISNRNINDICNYFDVVQIALDGVNKETHELSRGKGTYEKVLNGIELLNGALGDSKLDQVLISMTMFHENKAEVGEMVRFAYSKDCNLSFFNVLPTGRAKNSNKLNWLQYDQYFEVVMDAYKEFSKIVNENLKRGNKTNFYIKPSNMRSGSIYTDEPILNCGLGVKELSIGSDGTIYPCRGLQQSDVSVGNVKNDNLQNLYQKSFDYFSSISVNQIPECKTCDVKHFCGGGCRLYGYSKDGLTGNDPNCKLYKSSIYSAMLCKDKNIDEVASTMNYLYFNSINIR